jgi:CBS-domain-containing membrane protein
MRVGEICSKAVISAAPDVDVVSAAKLMRQHHVGTLVVVEPRGSMPIPTGIVTDRDLVVEVLAKHITPEQVCLGDLVTTPLSTAAVNDDLFETLGRMRSEGVRRLPVVDAHKRLVGLLSVDDISSALARLISELPKLVRRARDVELVRRP